MQAQCEVIIETNEITREWTPVDEAFIPSFGLPESIASFDTENNPFEAGDRIDILAGFLFVDVDEFQQPLSITSSETTNTQGTWILGDLYNEVNEDSSPQFMIQRVISGVEIIGIESSAYPITIYNDEPEEFIMLAVSSDEADILVYLIEAQIPMALMYTAEIEE